MVCFNYICKKNLFIGEKIYKNINSLFIYLLVNIYKLNMCYILGIVFSIEGYKLVNIIFMVIGVLEFIF